MTFSLLLHALEPKPTRQELEEISVNVRSIARADCAFMAEDWFGIVRSGLTIEEAALFQRGLRGKGMETDIVPDADIPALHHDFRCQRIDLSPQEITLTTALNRRQVRPMDELVFIAAGIVDRQRPVTKPELFQEVKHTTRGSYISTSPKNVQRMEEKRYFRIDLFFSSEPFRVSLEMGKDTVIAYGERLLRMKNTVELTVLLIDLQGLLPSERANRGICDLSTEALYPSLHAYEEEIRWSFYRLGARG
ncbi:MAG: hypothetical protein ACSHX7_13700 [Luteolibacter sp.]